MGFDPVWGLAIAAPFIGSFLGTLALRLPAGEPVAFARSACPHCQTSLRALEMIPLVSWAAQRGKCRTCHQPLGLFYPVVELAALGIVLWAASRLDGGELMAGTLFGWLLLALAAADARTGLLPNALSAALAAAGLIAGALLWPGRVIHLVVGAVAGYGVFAGLAWFYRRVRGRSGLGEGDARLLAAIGAWVGWQGLPEVVLIAAATGLLWALVGAAAGRPVSATTRLAFGPHLCLAAWIVWLYGPFAFLLQDYAILG